MSKSDARYAGIGPLVIFGAGGHGVVVAEAAELAGYEITGFIDDNPDRTKATRRWPILGSESIRGASLIVAIGRNDVRAAKWRELASMGARFVSVVHPSAIISRSAQIGRGVFIGPNAVIHAEANIADGAIINSAAVIEHHCEIGSFAHIGPNAALGGGVNVGEQSLIGIGASVRPKAQIGKNTTIGVGSVVLDGLRDGEQAIGVPAKVESEAFPHDL